ncbi:MAG: hypothetical protein ABF979_16025 [Gluconobacter sp.]|uniref:hypothetical protein n=1 Tax=Gluconobacter sp. TaxID=1876758 RepID=UPI0039EAF14C
MNEEEKNTSNGIINDIDITTLAVNQLQLATLIRKMKASIASLAIQTVALTAASESGKNISEINGYSLKEIHKKVSDFLEDGYLDEITNDIKKNVKDIMEKSGFNHDKIIISETTKQADEKQEP